MQQKKVECSFDFSPMVLQIKGRSFKAFHKLLDCQNPDCLSFLPPLCYCSIIGSLILSPSVLLQASVVVSVKACLHLNVNLD